MEKHCFNCALTVLLMSLMWKTLFRLCFKRFGCFFIKKHCFDNLFIVLRLFPMETLFQLCFYYVFFVVENTVATMCLQCLGCCLYENTQFRPVFLQWFCYMCYEKHCVDRVFAMFWLLCI